MATPDINTFFIRSNNPDIFFRAFFGDGAPLVIDGYGGWSVVTHPKEIGTTEWVGRNPMAIEIPFTIDNWLSREPDPGVETEQMVRRLERLCGLGSHNEPPICRVNGHGVIPHDQHNAPDYHWWVVENVNWDRTMELRSGDTQRRLRCGGNIIIRQFIESDPLIRLRKKKKRRRGRGTAGQGPRSYNAKKGERLTKIAANFYGDPKKWKRIAEANGLRDMRVPKNMRLKIPWLGNTAHGEGRA